jgi:hypothetical protein
VKDANHSSLSFDSTLEKLLEADSLLADQESVLVNQLKILAKRRKSLGIVLNMFSQEDTTDVSSQKDTTDAVDLSLSDSLSLAALSEAAVESLAGNNGSNGVVPAESSEVQLDSKAPLDRPKPKSPPPAKSARRTVSRKKTAVVPPKPSGKSKATPKWQQYIKSGFGENASLPDVVAGVLTQKPDQVFDISDMMKAIFKEGMPSTTNSLARDRVSNILSAGARRKRWFRPKPGFYSLTVEKAKRKRIAKS